MALFREDIVGDVDGAAVERPGVAGGDRAAGLP